MATAIITRHLDHLTDVLRRSPKTVRNRRYALTRIEAWAGPAQPILYLTADDLRRWQRESTSHWQSSTLRSEIVQLTEFYRWAVRERLIDASPADVLLKPSPPRRLPRPARDRDITAALACAPPDAACIIAWSRYNGLRAMEIASLAWGHDVDLETRLVRVLGKGSKERVLAIAEPVLYYLARLPLPHRGPVIPRRDGYPGHCLPGRISTMAGDHFRTLDLDIRLHQCRHTFATIALEETHDLRGVQEALGHERPDTTCVYTRVTPSALAAIVAAASSSWHPPGYPPPGDPPHAA